MNNETISIKDFISAFGMATYIKLKKDRRIRYARKATANNDALIYLPKDYRSNSVVVSILISLKS